MNGHDCCCCCRRRWTHSADSSHSRRHPHCFDRRTDLAGHRRRRRCSRLRPRICSRPDPAAAAAVADSWTSTWAEGAWQDSAPSGTRREARARPRTTAGEASTPGKAGWWNRDTAEWSTRDNSGRPAHPNIRPAPREELRRPSLVGWNLE